MSRVQLALNVDDLEQAVAFYSRLFGAEPAKRKPGYANYALTRPPLKLVLIENPGQGGSINHLGVEVESTEHVQAEIARLAGAGLLAEEEMGTTCCYATQDKAWLTGPGGERWEVYTVLSDSDTFGAGSTTLTGAEQDTPAPSCCGNEQSEQQAGPRTTPSTAATNSRCCPRAAG